MRVELLDVCTPRSAFYAEKDPSDSLDKEPLFDSKASPEKGTVIRNKWSHDLFNKKKS